MTILRVILNVLVLIHEYTLFEKICEYKLLSRNFFGAIKLHMVFWELKEKARHVKCLFRPMAQLERPLALAYRGINIGHWRGFMYVLLGMKPSLSFFIYYTLQESSA